MMNAQLTWKQNMAFECENHGVKTMTDATLDTGGSGLGPTPKELVMNAMMGCTAMDVVAILKKMRQQIDSFRMEIEVEKTFEHPIHFKSALLKYHLQGELDPEKVKKAVQSSLTRYCGVNYMVSLSCEISYRVYLGETEIDSGRVDFKIPA